jgi:hypothetical protein
VQAASNATASAMRMPSTLDFTIVCMRQTSGDSTDRVSGFISPLRGAGFRNRLRLGCPRCRGPERSAAPPNPVRPIPGYAVFRFRTMACRPGPAILSQRNAAAGCLPDTGLAQRSSCGFVNRFQAQTHPGEAPGRHGQRAQTPSRLAGLQQNTLHGLQSQPLRIHRPIG